MVEPITSGGMIGQMLLGGAGLGGIVWLVWEKIQNSSLKSANNEAGVAVADAQKQVYDMMTARLDALEKETADLRKQVDTERQHRMLLEKHVWKLEAMLHKAGIEPPVLEIAKA